MEETPKTLASGRFVLERELGRGHAGIVYLAGDRLRGEPIALKTAPGHPETTRREYDVLVAIGHPNVVRALECFHRETVPFFTMELVDGDDIVAHVRREEELTPHPASFRDSVPVAMGQAIREPYASAYRRCSADGFVRLRRAVRQTTEGLDAIHMAGFIHGDLQPSNVLVTDGERIVIVDLELAARPDVQPELVGTAPYLAPEHGEPGLWGPAADWYALGVITFEAITGQVAFEGAGPDALARKQATSPPDPVDLVGQIPEDLRQVCIGLLHRHPRGRFAAGDVLRILT